MPKRSSRQQSRNRAKIGADDTHTFIDKDRLEELLKQDVAQLNKAYRRELFTGTSKLLTESTISLLQQSNLSDIFLLAGLDKVNFRVALHNRSSKSRKFVARYCFYIGSELRDEGYHGPVEIPPRIHGDWTLQVIVPKDLPDSTEIIFKIDFFQLENDERKQTFVGQHVSRLQIVDPQSKGNIANNGVFLFSIPSEPHIRRVVNETCSSLGVYDLPIGTTYFWENAKNQSQPVDLQPEDLGSQCTLTVNDNRRVLEFLVVPAVPVEWLYDVIAPKIQDVAEPPDWDSYWDSNLVATSALRELRSRDVKEETRKQLVDEISIIVRDRLENGYIDQPWCVSKSSKCGKTIFNRTVSSISRKVTLEMLRNARRRSGQQIVDDIPETADSHTPSIERPLEVIKGLLEKFKIKDLHPDWLEKTKWKEIFAKILGMMEITWEDIEPDSTEANELRDRLFRAAEEYIQMAGDMDEKMKDIAFMYYFAGMEPAAIALQCNLDSNRVSVKLNRMQPQLLKQALEQSLVSFSESQKEIVRRVIEGDNNKKIAEKLSILPDRVKREKDQILQAVAEKALQEALRPESIK
jgi:hypothetical protein